MASVCILSNRNSPPVNQWLSITHSPLSLATTSLLSDSVSLPILSTTRKWDHIIFVLLCLAYFIQHKVLTSAHLLQHHHSSLTSSSPWVLRLHHVPSPINPFSCADANFAQHRFQNVPPSARLASPSAAWSGKLQNSSPGWTQWSDLAPSPHA